MSLTLMDLPSFVRSARMIPLSLEASEAKETASIRARKIMDIEALNAGQEFEELPETYTIFVTENDFFGKGVGLYPIGRMNLATQSPFNDREHIIYVNGQYNGDDDLGRLMHDFLCNDPDDMHFDILAERSRYFKENPEGVSEIRCPYAPFDRRRSIRSYRRIRFWKRSMMR